MSAIAVTIAGSDSGGGAGIQADLKSFSANGVYGASVITALTAQNTLGVTAIHDVPTDFIAAQIDAVFSDLAVNATKIGMLSQVGVIEEVAAGLARHETGPVVLDPVMVAASGDPLLADDAVDTLVSRLFPVADVVTPNLHEAARVLGCAVADTDQDMVEQAQQLLKTGAKAVLLKGGHSLGDTSADLFLTLDDDPVWLRSKRIPTTNTHGTGCTLSSAIAAGLAKGENLQEALSNGKAYIQSAIEASDHLSIGKGHGPVHHFHAMWPKG